MQQFLDIEMKDLEYISLDIRGQLVHVTLYLDLYIQVNCPDK